MSAISQRIEPRQQDIGFVVRRLLPVRGMRSVGPFVFLDHMGPAYFVAAGTAGDVRPHPHIGLATVTYLSQGAMMHRDSLGTVQRIEPGAINLMVAGGAASSIPSVFRPTSVPPMWRWKGCRCGWHCHRRRSAVHRRSTTIRRRCCRSATSNAAACSC
ncbi:pirin family protein [Vogesella fluminis]|uniref:pirin family protein n=1 Tax=Vogesella fluminis TaxID=1069161 RepID=UPI00363B2979